MKRGSITGMLTPNSSRCSGSTPTHCRSGSFALSRRLKKSWPQFSGIAKACCCCYCCWRRSEMLTRLPYRVRWDISTAFPGWSLRTSSDGLTSPKMSLLVDSVPALLLVDYVSHKTTMTGPYYSELLKKLHHAAKEKRGKGKCWPDVHCSGCMTMHRRIGNIPEKKTNWFIYDE